MNISAALELYDSLCLDCRSQQCIRLHLDEGFLPVKVVHALPQEVDSELEFGLKFGSSLPFVGLGLDSICGRVVLVRQFLIDLHGFRNTVLVDQATASLFVLKKLFGYNPKFGTDSKALSYRDYFLWNVFISQTAATKSNNRVSVYLGSGEPPPINGRFGFLIFSLRLRWMIK